MNVFHHNSQQNKQMQLPAICIHGVQNEWQVCLFQASLSPGGGRRPSSVQENNTEGGQLKVL